MKTSTLLITGAVLIAAVFLLKKRQPAPAPAPAPKKKKKSLFGKILGGVRKVAGFVPGLPKFDYAPAYRGQLSTATIARGRLDKGGAVAVPSAPKAGR